MIETWKSKETQKLKFTEYIHVIAKIISSISKKLYNAVLWRQTRCPTQMLARAC